MKKLLVALLALVSLAVVAAGCGGDKKADNGADKKVTLKVGATAVPHAEILNQIKGTLAKEGVDLQIIEFSDYVKPNLALNDKELDANFFQHEPYLRFRAQDESCIRRQGTYRADGYLFQENQIFERYSGRR